MREPSNLREHGLMSYNRHRLRVIARTCLFIAVLGWASCVAQQLTGKWEGAYSESRRMIVFGIDFESETKGMLQILGQQIGVTATRGMEALRYAQVALIPRFSR